MLSDNPKSGFYEADTSRCLDANGGNPSCNQGGIAVIAIEGNGCRPSHNGDGFKESDVMYTLNTIEHHAVAFADKSATLSAAEGPKGPSSQQLGNPEANFVAQPSNPYHGNKASYFMNFSDDDAVGALVATDYKDPPAVMEEPYYIVRRLTPIECARLQGFPDWWCDELASEDPSDEETVRWMEVFETYAKVMGTKPKTKNQVIRWLKDPCSDSAAYKMWGNGVALPNVFFVLSGIVYYSQFQPDLL
jgi:DNA (cytosine-5)-methyltransferase 1